MMMTSKGAQKKQQNLGEKQQNLGEKLRKVGKRGGHTTPIIPFWRLHNHQQNHTVFGADPFDFSCVSARKLAATIWELHSYNLPLSKMQQLRRIEPHRRRVHHHRLYENTGLDQPPDPSPALPNLPGSAGSLRRHVAESLMKHHQSIERRSCAIQPVSPASCSNSMEQVAPYNTIATPSSSIGFKGRIMEGDYNIKTSTELLRVLNRIWSLEEQQASNMALVRKLKKELDHAHTRIKELLRERQADKQEVDELMKHIRKSEEQDRIKAALQSVRDELENEKKLRKRSESLHRKLARELSESKSSLAVAVKELERERQSSKLLEDLCDEFALGIRDYEQEVHFLRQKSDGEWTVRTDNDRLILHMSESWLDERMQVELQPQNSGKRAPTVEKLSSEIEAFLRTKRAARKGYGNSGGPTYRRSSLESFPLNAVVSAPRDEGDDNSACSDSHCFELHKASAVDLISAENEAKRHEIEEMEKLEMQKFQDEMAQATLASEDFEPRKAIQENLAETSSSKKYDRFKITEEASSEKNSKSRVTPGLNSDYVFDDLIRSCYLLPQSGTKLPENEYGVASFGDSNWRSRASPVRQWTDKLPPHDNESGSSSKLPPDKKERSLKAKQQGQRSHTRQKGSKISL